MSCQLQEWWINREQNQTQACVMIPAGNWRSPLQAAQSGCHSFRSGDQDKVSLGLFPRAASVGEAAEAQSEVCVLELWTQVQFCAAHNKRTKVLEAAVTFQAVSAQCGPVLSLGIFHLCIPGQLCPSRMLCPGLGGAGCAHTHLCPATHPSAGAGLSPWLSAQCLCRSGSQLWERGDTVLNWCHESQCL